ncbi:nucleoside phosphorylase domain-containing protein [Aspergillus carlsbadensis]|nr:nucleoside phosphorylase domain-containing protein [Aspergillus carlsbadensis]
MSRPPTHGEFSAGWICALLLELAAVRAILDEEFGDLPMRPNDHNTYTLGRVGEHNVVIACLPSGRYGIASAATVARYLQSSFQSVKIGLLVGIGNGIPSKKTDIRLGDVVVSIPISSGTHEGIIQYDLGKAGQGDTLERTGMLNRPPQILSTAASKLQAVHQMEGNRIAGSIKKIAKKSLSLRDTLEVLYRRDFLFDADYHHDQTESTCDACDIERIIYQPSRVTRDPVVHYGLIASGNGVVRDSHFQDHLGRELGACCVDMEAAGLVNNFPCLAIRGICDYADSHKNKDWQGYATAVAAAWQYICCWLGELEETTGILGLLLPSTLEVPHSGGTYPVDSFWDEIEYPKVSIGEYYEIGIDRHNINEIRRYVARKLATVGLEGHEQWVELATSIVDQSAGVFLWAVIVMDTLLKAWDNSKNFTYLKQRLQKIPPALEQLYERILSTTDTQDTQMTLRFFYWVILAAKPLRLLEWHHIIAWIRDKPPTSLQEWRESNYYTKNTWQLEQQIQAISRG